MKKIIFILFIFFVTVYLFTFKKNNCQNKKAKVYKINNKDYCLLTANSRQDWEKGLMFYKKPVDFDGMIFIFPNKETKSFWNENTYLDLDIYWMDGEKIVGKSSLPSIEKSKEVVIIESKVKVDKAVELIK